MKTLTFGNLEITESSLESEINEIAEDLSEFNVEQMSDEQLDDAILDYLDGENYSTNNLKGHLVEVVKERLRRQL